MPSNFDLGMFVLGACVALIGVVAVNCFIAWLDMHICKVMLDVEEGIAQLDGEPKDGGEEHSSGGLTIPVSDDGAASRVSIQMATTTFMFGAFSDAIKRVEVADIPEELSRFVLNGPRKKILDVFSLDLGKEGDTLYFVHSSRGKGHCSNGFIAYIGGVWGGLETDGTPLSDLRDGLTYRVHSYDGALGYNDMPEASSSSIPQSMIDFINRININGEEGQAK